MSELPTLRAALRETAERRYGRARRARAVARSAVAAVLALLAVGGGLVVVSELGESRSADEIPATATPAATSTPGASATDMPESLRFPRATAADVKDPHLRALLGTGHMIVRAWSIPAFKGHVLLSSNGGNRCLSVPDTTTDQPDIERGMSCSTNAQSSVSVTIGSDYVAVILDEGAKPPTLRLPNGRQRTLKPLQAGLIALADVPAGSSITLYDRAGKARTDRIQGPPALPTRPPGDPDGSHGEKPTG